MNTKIGFGQKFNNKEFKTHVNKVFNKIRTNSNKQTKDLDELFINQIKELCDEFIELDIQTTKEAQKVLSNFIKRNTHNQKNFPLTPKKIAEKGAKLFEITEKQGENKSANIIKSQTLYNLVNFKFLQLTKRKSKKLNKL